MASAAAVAAAGAGAGAGAAVSPPTTTPPPALARVQEAVWAGRIPLEISLAPDECRTYDQADPYLVRV